ncbi:MAG TPA: signal peptidase I [Gaiellaceae bacterium]|nr:signal peptidase I [Gaiellaceae bacterium]
MRSSVETLPLPRTSSATRRHGLPDWLPLKRLLVMLAQLGLVAAMLWFCLPQSLGGRAGWVVVSGTSMLPHMHTGDLALVERQSSYHVGEVIAYRVPQGQVGAGYEVIHRIVGGNARTGWIVQGDNRTLPDLWHPHNSDIVGARLLWIPKAYLLLRFLHTPLLLGLLAGFGIFFKILLGEKGDAEPEGTEQDS